MCVYIHICFLLTFGEGETDLVNVREKTTKKLCFEIMLASLESTLLQKFQKSKHTASTDNITDEGPCQVMIFANNTVEMATYDFQGWHLGQTAFILSP